MYVFFYPQNLTDFTSFCYTIVMIFAVFSYRVREERVVN